MPAAVPTSDRVIIVHADAVVVVIVIVNIVVIVVIGRGGAYDVDGAPRRHASGSLLSLKLLIGAHRDGAGAVASYAVPLAGSRRVGEGNGA